MNIISNFFINRSYCSYYKKLENIDPDKMEKISEKKAVKAFQYAAKHSKYYKKILKQYNINHKNINDIHNFKKYVPIINKEDIFKNNNLHDLINNVSSEISQYLISSGYSNIMAYNIEKKKHRNQKMKI